MDDVASTVAAYDALISRALKILATYPSMPAVRPFGARLELQGDRAVLRWAHGVDEFDARLLALSDDEFARWQQVQAAKAETACHCPSATAARGTTQEPPTATTFGSAR